MDQTKEDHINDQAQNGDEARDRENICGYAGGVHYPVTFCCVATSWMFANNHLSLHLNFMCKGNHTILRRILYLDLAKGNPKRML
jgi:hypothetical protein